MTNDTRERIDDAALDALIAQAARVEAPAGFAVRVHAALDSQHTSGAGLQSCAPWLRPALAMAAMLLLAVLWWALQPVPAKPDISREASASAAAPLPPPHLPVLRRTGRRDKPVASTFAAHAASASAAAPLRRDKPVYVRIDHERALDALDAVTAMQQKAIEPAVIATSAIEVQPADSIAPLNVDTNGPDPGGQGDH